MRLRALLLSFILAALLLGLPGIAISSATSYRASEASLRSLWAADIAAGVSPTQLSALQAELVAADAATFASLPTVTFNPIQANSLIIALRERTNAIYFNDLSNARTDALAARTLLQFALGPVSVSQTHLWREEFDSAATPADYSALADSWRLDALLVPLDTSLNTYFTTLKALVVQATSLSLASSDATALTLDLTTYFDASPATRYASATTLVTRSAAVTTSLHSSIDAELASRAARAAAAAAVKAEADAAAARAATTTARVRPPVVRPPSQPPAIVPPPSSPPGPTPSPSPPPGNGPLALTLNGNYTDCTGAAILPGGLYRDTCLNPIIYLVSHKWSIGASFFALHIGSLISLQGQTYTVYNVYHITPAAEEALLSASGAQPPLVLQTCYTDSGSLLLIIEAH